MTGPSKHLSWAELACKDGTPYPREWADRAAVLAAEFEAVRAVCGQPLVVLSAFRTAEHNRAIGGARNSQHVQGRALDVKPPKGWTVARLYDVIRSRAGMAASAINGIGIYGGFVHFDIRPLRADGRLTVWRGTRAWAEAR